MKSFIITATGTDIGKTLVTASLCHQLKNKNKKVFALKPVVSGWNEKNNDVFEILDSIGLPRTKSNIEKISLYRFKAPLSPDIAAKKEKRKINFQKLLEFCKAPKNLDYLFIEGIGGVMVPLDKNKTTLDLFAALKMPVILVSGSYLGCLNHTLTAISAIESRGIKIKTVIVSESENSVGIDDVAASLRNHTRYKIIKIPRIAKAKEKWKYAPELIEGIL